MLHLGHRRKFSFISCARDNLSTTTPATTTAAAAPPPSTTPTLTLGISLNDEDSCFQSRYCLQVLGAWCSNKHCTQNRYPHVHASSGRTPVYRTTFPHPFGFGHNISSGVTLQKLRNTNCWYRRKSTGAASVPHVHSSTTCLQSGSAKQRVSDTHCGPVLTAAFRCAAQQDRQNKWPHARMPTRSHAGTSS